jgi:hypothetical protein
MFTDMDVACMKSRMDLTDRDSVKKHAFAIYAAVQQGTMPPPGEGFTRWTSDMCATFKRWEDQGFPQ